MTDSHTETTPSPSFTHDQLQMAARLAGADPRIPAVIDDTLDHSWTIRGMPWHYTNKSGRIINHPSAYSKKGWSSLVYHASDRHIAMRSDYVQTCIDQGIQTQRILGINTVFLATPQLTMGKFTVHRAAARKDGQRQWLVRHPDHAPYHFVRTNTARLNDEARVAMSGAIVAWRAQRVNIANQQRFYHEHRNKFIGIPHLLAIGACEPGAKAALDWIMNKLGLKDIGAVRADAVINATRNNWRHSWACKAIKATVGA